jgi:periplasmic protein TonB
MPILEENSNAEVSSTLLQLDSEQKQHRKMLVALALLLVALVLVLFKNRDFLFPSSTTTESEPVDQPASGTAAKPRSRASNGRRTASVSPKPKPHATATANAPSAKAELAPVITNRTLLPPLEVEVVAGNQHRIIQPGSNSIKVEVQRSGTSAAAAVTSPAAGGDGGSTAAGPSERVVLSPDTTQIVSHHVEPTYPLLAKQMKVQGSVVLQALVGKEGNIQNLQVLSGPAILSSAAREAVKQWRFKPYYQAGHPVETEARITVNFTISTQ